MANKSEKNKLVIQNATTVNVDFKSSNFLEKTFHHLAVYFVNYMVGYKVKNEAEVQILLNKLIICTPGECLFPRQSFTSNKLPGL